MCLLSNNLRLPLLRYLIQAGCFRECFCGLCESYSLQDAHWIKSVKYEKLLYLWSFKCRQLFGCVSCLLFRMRMKTEPVKARKRNWKKKLHQDTRLLAVGSEYLACLCSCEGSGWSKGRLMSISTSSLPSSPPSSTKCLLIINQWVTFGGFYFFRLIFFWSFH